MSDLCSRTGVLTVAVVLALSGGGWASEEKQGSSGTPLRGSSAQADSLARASASARSEGVQPAGEPTLSGPGAVAPLALDRNPRSPRAVLYDQTDAAGTSGYTSQDFEAGFDAYDNQLGDDFVVPTGGWSIDTVEVRGDYWNGVGPAPFVHIWFYADAAGMPGAPVYEALEVVSGDDGFGNFTIALPAPAVLDEGTYWLSVQARMDFNPAGQWMWLERTVQSHAPSVWRNPGNGFGTGCTSWTPRTLCGLGITPDLVFRLLGTPGGGPTVVCSTPALPIPDGNPAGAFDDLVVAEPGFIADLDVWVDVTHTWVGDVELRLTRLDSGTTATFFDRPGVPGTTYGCSGDDILVQANDEGWDPPIENQCGNLPAISGSAPGGDPPSSSLLAAFDGESLAGTWRLTASDHIGGDTGTVNVWCLVVTTGSLAPPLIEVDPPSLGSSQPPGTVVTLGLEIANQGGADLDWAIAEAPVGAARASGHVILSQLPNAVNGYFSDAACSLCGTGQQSIAENFSLAAPAEIAQIVIWNGYFPTDVPTTSDFYTVNFRADAAGLPGAAIYTEALVAYEGEQTEVVIFGVHRWRTLLTLGGTVTLAPGVYWLEIFNDTGAGASPDDAFWETGNPDTVGTGLPGNAWATQTPGATWSFQDGDLALLLLGPPAPCDDPSDLPWLEVVPPNGSTAGGASTPVAVTVDSTGLAVGTYEAHLCVSSNDPVTPRVEVPVTLEVLEDPMPFLDGFETGNTGRWSVAVP
jgi:hypothetical protein